MIRRLLVIEILAGLFLSPAILVAAEAATWSFAVADNAARPRTVTAAGGKIVVDLSSLPKPAKVFQATLRMRRTRAPGWQREGDRALIEPADKPGELLALRPPRYNSFDATGAVARALKANAGKVEFLVKSLSGWKRESTRLDVSFTGGKAESELPKVTGLTARHRSGQTLLTWKEVNPPTTAETMTIEQWRALRKKLAAEPSSTTYRIYRHTAPINAKTIAAAELVDEVGPLTCWNPDFHGIYPPKGSKLRRYVVVDGKAPVPPATGIYANNPSRPGRAYYAVTAAVNGEEDLAAFSAGNALAKPVEEVVGPGDPILQRIETPDTFFYTKGITLHYFVRWEARPRCNLPSRAYDYLVTVPMKRLKPAPVNLVLHCWGSNLYGKGGAYSWHGWKDKTRGIGVASNQIPYDWWTCYHENRGTWKPWTAGVTRDFTVKRLLAFLDWAGTKWQLDKARICVSGESMGGSGSTFMPIRYAGRFAYAYSAVGIHNPISIKPSGFYESYARVCGIDEAKIKHESGMATFDYLNDPLLVRKNPRANLPFIGFGNGKNDHGIGWPHAVDLAKAFQQARQPHAVIWRLRGHASGSFYPNIDFRADQSLPAFTACSLDDDIGTATRLKEAKPFKLPWGQVAKDVYDGDPEGQINTYLRWRTDDIVDEPATWEITVYLASGSHGAPKDDCTVNITPRRLQKLQIKPGQRFKWTSTPVADGGQVQSGTAVGDKHGLVTMEKVVVHKSGSRLRLVPAE